MNPNKVEKAGQSQVFTAIILAYQIISDIWCSPGAVVADSDAVQAGDSENTQGQGDEDNVKHFELWVRKNTWV